LQFVIYFTGLPDPFAKISVDGSGQCHSTDTCKATLDPKWNQHYDLCVFVWYVVNIDSFMSVEVYIEYLNISVFLLQLHWQGWWHYNQCVEP